MPPPRFYQPRARVPLKIGKVGTVRVPRDLQSARDARQSRVLADLEVIKANLKQIDSAIEYVLAKTYRPLRSLYKKRKYYERRMAKWSKLNPLRKDRHSEGLPTKTEKK